MYKRQVIKGEDEVTGKIYDALDHDQLLWVHACLQLSSIFFFEKTVRKLSEKEKDTYHKENMLSAKLVLIDENKMPQTHKELENWVIDLTRRKQFLLITDVANDVKSIIQTGPVPGHIKPIWPFISFMAFHTLPEEFRNLYGVSQTKWHKKVVNFNLSLLRITRPFLPPFFRLIPPARWARQRIRNRPDLQFKQKSKI